MSLTKDGKKTAFQNVAMRISSKPGKSMEIMLRLN